MATMVQEPPKNEVGVQAIVLDRIWTRQVRRQTERRASKALQHEGVAEDGVHFEWKHLERVERERGGEVVDLGPGWRLFAWGMKA